MKKSGKNNSESNVSKKDSKFLDKVAKIVTYSHTFEKEVGLPFVEPRIKDFVYYILR